MDAMKSPLSVGLTGNQLKVIAMVSMLVDHVGLFLFPSVLLFRMIGRIAFPIFAYMIAEGCRYTRHRLRYLLGIALLGAACQAVASVATGTLHMGILLTFSLSIVTIYAIDAFLAKRTLLRALGAAGVVLAVLLIAAVMPLWLDGYGFKVDYDIFGVALPVLLYYARGRVPKLIGMTAILLAHALFSRPFQFCALFAVPLLFLYNGKRGAARLKYLFYIFYPLHLAVIYLIKYLIAVL